jgi:tetratricopeptide (TPR) repeat protein
VPLKVFMSHTGKDKGLADALAALLTDTFGADVVVQYSSDQSAGGGISLGTDWREWIREQVESCDIALIVLSEESLTRPWLMWEAGAVTGFALAAERKPLMKPLLFRVKAEDVPDPLRNLQAAPGEKIEGINRLLRETREKLGTLQPGQLEMIVRVTVPTYLKAVEEALSARPQALTEGDVQEWCERLDELRRSRRSSQVDHVHRALRLSFGTLAGDTGPVPLDVRLHRRLGELYLDARRGREAAAEFDLASKLSPRDVYLLHKLALAQLEAGDQGQAEQTLARIRGLDPQADRVNPEIAGLTGRIFRERHRRTGDPADLRAARDAYLNAFEASPESYYLAANAGELSFTLGEPDAARDAYRRAEAAIHLGREDNVWTNATLAAAGLVRGRDRAEVLELLTAARRAGSSARDVNSIWQGLERLSRYLGSTAQEMEAWRAALGLSVGA